jgi:hypothetical protein
VSGEAATSGPWMVERLRSASFSLKRSREPMYIRLRCPLALLLLSDEVLLLASDVFLGMPASILILPKLLADRPECADCSDAELPPLLPM